MRKSLLLLALLPLLAACASEAPIKKANCWSSMSFVETRDCAAQR